MGAKKRFSLVAGFHRSATELWTKVDVARKIIKMPSPKKFTNRKNAADTLRKALPGVPEGILQSELLTVLDEKLAALAPDSFPFLAELQRLREVVVPQIGDTRLLFPEFTPHDETHHVRQLFSLADKLFGTAVFGRMNATELFLLACALYAHDWGMAVGKKEQSFLHAGASTSHGVDGFSLLLDEAERLDAFRRTQGLPNNSSGDVQKLSDEQLRLYVRNTHARRSAARVRQFFSSYPDVGNALAQLCEGHWHDFAVLRDPSRFDRKYEVGSERAHLLALALQLRLIDLFHITYDRTPYSLWRFVSPKDHHSEEEWAKHRALHAVAVDAFPPGRLIRVQGFTDDAQVWAGLQDLRRYCEGQIAGTLDVSAQERLSDQYGLDFIKLDWAVKTGSLQPIDLRFEFDRKAMLRILSEEIYDGDQHIILRELLQNSIDALRTRRARRLQMRASAGMVRRRPVPGDDELEDPTIYFTARHNDDGSLTLSCRDYGIGMDEHVLRNYFAVAGVSYYRSEEFYRQSLGFEPVSRFGVGALSCFMVAASVDVRTYRDPDCGPALAAADLRLPGAEAHRARRLHVHIPSLERQFVVRDGEPEFAVGTEVTLNIPSHASQELMQEWTADTAAFIRRLGVTEYLRETAGFVEFPILVHETWPGQAAPLLTLILHPDRDPSAEKRKYDDGVIVHQLSRAYPWQDVVAPECIDAAKQVLSQYTFEVADLLPSQGYEGWISYIGPKEIDHWDFEKESDVFSFHMRMDESQVGEKIYTTGSQAAQRFYRDGILLSRMHVRSSYQPPGQFLPSPYIIINLPAIETFRPNLARTAVSSASQQWFSHIERAIFAKIASTSVSDALQGSTMLQLHRLSWLAHIFRLDPKLLAGVVLPEIQAIPIVTQEGEFLTQKGYLASAEQICILPADIVQMIFENRQWCAACKGFTTDRIQWRGPTAVVAATGWRSSGEGLLPTRNSIIAEWLDHFTFPTKVQFLTQPPTHANMVSVVVANRIRSASDIPALSVTQWRNAERAEVCTTLRQIISRSEQGGVSEWNLVKVLGERLLRQNRWPCEFLYFEKPFDRKFAYQNFGINVAHPYSVQLLRCLAAVLLEVQEDRLTKSAITHLKSVLSLIGGHSSAFSYGTAAVETGKGLFQFVEEHRLLENFSPPPDPDLSEFVPTYFNMRSPYTLSDGKLILNPPPEPNEVFGLPIDLRP